MSRHISAAVSALSSLLPGLSPREVLAVVTGPREQWPEALRQAARGDCAELAPGEEECVGRSDHFDAGGAYVRACPQRQRTEQAERAAERRRDGVRRERAERERLARVIGRLCRAPWDDSRGPLDEQGVPQAKRAREACEIWTAGLVAADRDGASLVRSLALQGPRGVGKTRLLLEAVHLPLVRAGLLSVWVSSVTDLVSQRRQRLSVDHRVAAEGEARFETLRSAQCLVIPDLGSPELATASAELVAVAAELTDLLDAGSFAVAWATNAGSAELARDPSVGSRLFSRIFENATAIVMRGSDNRARKDPK